MTPPTPEAPHMPSGQTRESIPGCWPRLHNSRLMLAGRLAGAVPSGGDRQSGQSGNRLRAGLMHDRSTVILDGALADAELPGDNFIGSAGQDQFQDLLLSGVSVATRDAAVSRAAYSVCTTDPDFRSSLLTTQRLNFRECLPQFSFPRCQCAVVARCRRLPPLFKPYDIPFRFRPGPNPSEMLTTSQPRRPRGT